MGRWTQYDEDDYRLPDGMKRVGYDSDTGKYYFRDRDGSLWEGSEYGEMQRGTNNNDVEIGPDGYIPLAEDADQPPRPKLSSNDSPYRMLFPFFLIVIVVLLLVWRLIVAPANSRPVLTCPEHSTSSVIVFGDTCWAIAQAHGCVVDDILRLNPKLNCDVLRPGARICIPSGQ
ncbi:hypothetical protein HETIRDRAFT_413020 [Heterobasidion irregulare TC 32-1]|uniref:LysM domain-containing protein n=1 Tax=Heterobasidion irregulare (strain TC 32-1) TaxID=747525 RepID=W4KLN4_HETIT|nr:uncharacterized protein HETIRDRAFT_413020 [Heterobasidion irregulare TC 32-1]ETW86619.1 hypothetical protein HETIRDRAFT_413020 [Heterobasidion irregulare TC 32-1]